MPAYLLPIFMQLLDKRKEYTPTRKNQETVIQEIPQQRQESEQIEMDREELSYEEYTAREEKMLASVDLNFVETLKEVCKFYGWTGDYVEVRDFFRHVAGLQEIDIRSDNESLSPYWYDEEMLRTPVEQMNYQELQDEWRQLATVSEANWSRRCKILAEEIRERERNGQR